MKKGIVVVALCCFSFCCNPLAAQNSLKGILGNVAKETVNKLSGEIPLTMGSLCGTWNYVEPVCKLESDNVLNDIGGELLTAEMEKRLLDACAKVGIKKGTFGYTFSSDSTFTNRISNKELSGTVIFDESTQQIELVYKAAGLLQIATLKGVVKRSGENIMLLFDADKCLAFLSTLSSFSANKTLQAIGNLSEKYKKFKLGFELSL